MFVSFTSNTTGSTCGSGTDYPSGAPEFIPVFYVVDRSLVCIILFCGSFFAFGCCSVCLSSTYPLLVYYNHSFGIFVVFVVTYLALLSIIYHFLKYFLNIEKIKDIINHFSPSGKRI
jgi:hypothetical protein